MDHCVGVLAGSKATMPKALDRARPSHPLLEKDTTMRLQNKVAVITGAGSGMGRAMAILFAQEGAKIVAGEWNEQTLAEIVAAVKAAGGDITGVKINVANQAEAE